MDTNFEFKAAGKNEPVYFEQVFAEKPGGGVIAAPDFDAEPTTAVGVDTSGKLKLIKGYKLAKAVAAADTSIKLEKGSGIKAGEFIGHGKKALAAGAVTEGDDYDTVTVTMGVVIAAGTVLFQAKGASSETVDAEPLLTPKYVIGGWVRKGKGDQEVRLVNGANLRKDTANVAEEVAALLPGITLV